MSKQPIVEKREFRAHQNLITDVIMRQAGTLAKAITEGVQNAVDAGATKMIIELSADTLTLEDNGRGFASADSIKEVFEVFGQPHERDEDGISTDAKFGTFRMGRGQLFAFGANTWRTNTFQMQANIKRDGLTYKLLSGLKSAPGCRVEVALYHLLRLGDIRGIVLEVTKLCKYVDLDVVMNGTRISVDYREEKWNYADARMCLTAKASEHRYSDTVLLYNQGVFVESVSSYDLGFSGTVLVHTPMLLNFARNQVIRSCKVWRAAVEKARELACVMAKNRKLTQSEASGILQQYLTGTSAFRDVEKVKCVADSNGRLSSLQEIVSNAKALARVEGHSRFRTSELGAAITVAPAGSRAGDMVLQLRRGRVIDRKALAAIDGEGVSGKELLQKFLTKLGDDSGASMKVFGIYESPEDILGPTFSTDTHILEDSQLTPRERMILNAASRHPMCHEKTERKLMLGDSTMADGWTDGANYIAVSRQFLERQEFGAETGWHALALLICHEYAHDSADIGTHEHTFDFYREYHDMSVAAPAWARQMFISYWMSSKRNAVRKGRKIDEKRVRELHRRAEVFAANEMLTENETITTESGADKAHEPAEAGDKPAGRKRRSGRGAGGSSESEEGFRRDIVA